MAKSIYETLADGKTETSVPAVTDKKTGNVLRPDMGMVSHTLPLDKLPTPEEFQDADKLLAWARESGQLHACLQSGVQARVIDYRAIFKAMPKKSDLEAGREWTAEFGQDNVNNAEWKVVTPSLGGGDKKKVEQAVLQAGVAMARAMLAAKLKQPQIMAALVPVYGQNGAEQIWEEINKEE